MIDLNISVTVCRPELMPVYATPGAAAADLRADIARPVDIAAGCIAMISTGVSIALPDGYAALVFARSGLASKQGITLANGVGLIDSDYRGVIAIALHNISDKCYTVQPLDRIAQLSVVPVAHCHFSAVGALDATDRGSGGFGSTGTI